MSVIKLLRLQDEDMSSPYNKKILSSWFFQLVMFLSLLVTWFYVYCSMHCFVDAGLLSVQFTWPYIFYLGSNYY